MRHQLTAEPLQIKYRPIVDLKVNPRNAREHDPAQVSLIADSIKRFGFANPILIDDKGMIRAGHGRALAAREADLREVPTITLHGLTEHEWRVLALADNQLALNSSWNADILRAELLGLREDGEDVLGLGFREKEIDGLLGNGEDEDPVEVREIEVGEVEDRFWIAIRGPIKDQAAALLALEEAMKPFADVEVELGTIPVEG